MTSLTTSVSPAAIRGVNCGADARHHPASDERRTVQRHILADRHAGVLVDQHLLGEGRQVQILHHRPLGRAEPRLFVLLALGLRRDAQAHVAGQAEFAVAAEGREAGDHVIARLNGANLGAHLLDDTGALMAENGRQRVRVGTLDEMQVGVADTGGRSADQHLVRARLVDLHIFDLKRGAHFAQNGGFHPNVPFHGLLRAEPSRQSLIADQMRGPRSFGRPGRKSLRPRHWGRHSVALDARTGRWTRRRNRPAQTSSCGNRQVKSSRPSCVWAADLHDPTRVCRAARLAG